MNLVTVVMGKNEVTQAGHCFSIPTPPFCRQLLCPQVPICQTSMG